ncbi:MAG: hypothetical protein JNJ78_13530 [Anaerolineae bacterium]|nr:hypothetical protein [Anaerolineae bacterium]
MKVWVTALLVFIAAIIVYRVTVTSVFSGDDLQYTSVIHQMVNQDFFYHPTGGQAYIANGETRPIQTVSINPRYLLEWPTSALAGKIGQAIGSQDTLIPAIQTLRILVGALGLAVFFLAVYTLTENQVIAIVTSAGLGLSVSYWTYSIHMDQSINMVCLLCMAFYVFVRQIKSGFNTRGTLLMIILLAFASFYNFTAAVSAAAFGVGYVLFQPGFNPVRALRQLISFGAVYAIIVVGVILGAIAVFVSPSSVFDPAFWRAATFGGKPEYFINPVSDAIRAAIGLGKSQILFPGLYGSVNDFFETASGSSRILLAAYYGVVLVVLISPFIFLFLQRRKSGNGSKVAAFLFVWLLAHSLFNWFWDPGFNKYWLIPLVCCWAAAAIAINLLRTSANRFYKPVLLVALAVAIVSFGINLSTQFLPDSKADENEWLQIAYAMKTETQAEDLFLSPAHEMDFYLTFFARRDVLSAGLIAYDTNEAVSNLTNIVNERIETHRADNGQIYVYGLEDLPEDELAAFRELLADGELREAWVFPEATIYELVSPTS